MRFIIILTSVIFSFSKITASEISFSYSGDTLNPRKWTKADFIKETGFNDSAKALINLFFTKNNKGKNQAIIGGAFFIGGGIALSVPHESGDDYITAGDMFRPVAEYGSVVLGVLLTTTGIICLKKFSKEKLYFLLRDYKNGIPIPVKYRKKLAMKYFQNFRTTITPRF